MAPEVVGDKQPVVQAPNPVQARPALVHWGASIAALEAALAAPNPDRDRVQALYHALNALECPVPNRAEIISRLFSRIAEAFD